MSRPKSAGKCDTSKARREVARLALRDSARLEWWQTACRGAAAKGGTSSEACDVLGQAAAELRGLFACVSDPECMKIAAAARTDARRRA